MSNTWLTRGRVRPFADGGIPRKVSEKPYRMTPYQNRKRAADMNRKMAVEYNARTPNAATGEIWS